MTARERLHADLARYTRGLSSRRARTRRLLETEAVWAIVCFRFGQYLFQEAPRPLRLLLRVPYELVHRAVRLSLGIHLFPSTRVGPGLYLGHYGGIWISPHAELGTDCNVNHHVTIGFAGEGRAPRLGDRVWVGPSATVTGAVHVRSGAVVGANSLVVSDVPENAVVLGVPARVLSYGGSARLLNPLRKVG